MLQVSKFMAPSALYVLHPLELKLACAMPQLLSPSLQQLFQSMRCYHAPPTTVRVH